VPQSARRADILNFVGSWTAACPTLTINILMTLWYMHPQKMHTLGNPRTQAMHPTQAGLFIMAWHLLSHIVELGLIEPRAGKATRLFCRRYTLLVLKRIPPLCLKLTMLLKVPFTRYCAKEKESVKPSCSTCAVSGHLICRRHGLSDVVVAIRVQCRRSKAMALAGLPVID